MLLQFLLDKVSAKKAAVNPDTADPDTAKSVAVDSVSVDREAPKPSSKLSLGVILVVPFVIQIFATVGLVGYLSWQSGRKAVNDLSTQLRAEISNRIETHTLTYLDKVQAIAQVAVATMDSGNINPDDFAALERFFWQVVSHKELENYIYYANNRGHFLGVELREDGHFYLAIKNESTGPNRRIYQLDSQRKRVRVARTHKLDPRIRPWYKNAVEAGKPTWSPIYGFASRNPPVLGISPVIPVYGKTNVLRGVLSMDIRLAEISQFLQTLVTSPSGQSFIIERSGNLVASSKIEQPFTIKEKGKERVVERIKAVDSNEAIVADTTKYLIQNYGDLNNITDSQKLEFMDGDRRQFVHVNPLQDGRGINWLIVVVIPESDFMEQINTNIRNTVLLCLAALAIAIALGVLTARWIVRPILRLRDASHAIASGDLDRKVEIKSIEELDDLAQSFNQMAGQLQESFYALEKTNEELEHRVEDRTAELSKANQEITVLNERLKTENSRMSAELDVTRQLQQMILPKDEELKLIEGLDIAGFMEPAAEVGGDYYDVLQHNGKVKIGIGDVTGHGLESGVVMIMAQTAVRTLLAVNETDPVKFMTALNYAIYGNTRRMESYKNMTIALLDYEAGILSLSGQHEELIVVRNNGEIEQFDTIDLGFPLGIESDISSFIAETKIELQSGEVAILYTDGITEAVNGNNEQYGLEGMYKILKQNHHKSANEIRQAVINGVMAHIGTQKVFDDITLLVLKQK
jgi:sigma-B regulation protein RsbU (phosphoserine phosphatase)